MYCTVQFTLIIFGCNILITINYIIVITNILTVMSANDDLKQTKGEEGELIVSRQTAKECIFLIVIIKGHLKWKTRINITN